MARFRCPSDLSTRRGSILHANATTQGAPMPGPSSNPPNVPEEGPNHQHLAIRLKRGKGRRKDKGKGRFLAPARTDSWQKLDLLMSMKKYSRKTHTHEWSFVFVGNVSSSATEAQLQEMFEQFGPIRCVKIRASGGVCVPTANLPRPYWGYGSPLESVHYATVEFSSPGAAKKALAIHGQSFMGRKLVVSFNAVDLPETTNAIKDRLRRKDPQADKESVWGKRFKELKRMTIEKTEYVPDEPDPQTRAVKGQGKIAVGLFAERLGKMIPHQNRHGAIPPLLGV